MVEDISGVSRAGEVKVPLQLYLPWCNVFSGLKCRVVVPSMCTIQQSMGDECMTLLCYVMCGLSEHTRAPTSGEDAPWPLAI